MANHLHGSDTRTCAAARLQFGQGDQPAAADRAIGPDDCLGAAHIQQGELVFALRHPGRDQFAQAGSVLAWRGLPERMLPASPTSAASLEAIYQ